ncbi:hypothetical protein ERJ75_001147700 [Trypanosoma vivax]|nr:hypothetical protein ERJ75_001147700 [Trypanosoma vivax]
MGRLIAKTVALGAARHTWRARFGKSLAALRRDGVFDKAGRAGARGGGGGRTRFGPENSDAAGETRGPTRAAMRHRAVHGTLGRRFEQFREVNGPNVNDMRDMAKLPWAPAKAVGEDKAPGQLFNGHSILKRARITRVAAEEGQWRLAVAEGECGTLPLQRHGAASTARPCSASPRCGAIRSCPGTAFINREPKLRIDEAVAKEMEGAGVIFEASQKSTKGWVVPFTVVEGKAAGLRRCFISQPKGESDHGDCEAEGPLQHVPRYLHAAFGEVAAVFVLKASLFQVRLPQGSRASFRCRAEAGMLVEPTHLPTEYKCSPKCRARSRGCWLETPRW